MGAHEPLLVSNVKREALDGMVEIDLRWCFKAAVGLHAQEESMTEMSLPLLLVFECGILKLQ